MKRITTFVILAALILGISGCGKNNGGAIGAADLNQQTLEYSAEDIYEAVLNAKVNFVLAGDHLTTLLLYYVNEKVYSEEEMLEACLTYVLNPNAVGDEIEPITNANTHAIMSSKASTAVMSAVGAAATAQLMINEPNDKTCQLLSEYSDFMDSEKQELGKLRAQVGTTEEYISFLNDYLSRESVYHNELEDILEKLANELGIDYQREEVDVNNRIYTAKEEPIDCEC